MSISNQRLFFLVLNICLIFFFLVDISEAATSSGDLLTNIISTFESEAKKWEPVFIKHATYLFWTLGLISLIYSFGFHLFQGGSFGDFYSHFLKFIMFFGFYLFLLQKGVYIAATIIDSMLQIARETTGIDAHQASSFLEVIGNAWTRIIDATSLYEPLTSLILIIIALIVVVLFAIMVATIVVEYCTAWILMYAGCFFLGFGGSQWTSDMVITYFKAVFASGVRMMAMVMILGIGIGLIEIPLQALETKVTLDSSLYLLVATIVLYFVMIKLPDTLAGLIGGQIGNLGSPIGTSAAMGVAGMIGGAAGSFAGAKVGQAGRGLSTVKDAISTALKGGTG